MRTPPPPRAEFMALLDEHEAIVIETGLALHAHGHAGAELLERFRMSRRMVVASYDRACLSLTSGAQTS